MENREVTSGLFLSLPSENKERRLERILGILPPSHKLLADAEYHRPVALHESCECSLGHLVTPGQELLEQLPI